MRVLVAAGDRGYIGAVLVPFLRAADTRSTVSTSACTRDATSARPRKTRGRAPRCDMRDVAGRPAAGYDAVLCLAALSNDPLGDLNPAATYSVNLDGTLHLARAAKAGRSRAVPVRVILQPVRRGGLRGGRRRRRSVSRSRPTARPRFWPSASLSQLADDSFSPTYLRNATAYGASPRLRLDIVVNNLTAVAMTTGQVRLESDGSPWRPLVHIEDISRAFLAALEAPRELVHDEAFNVGRHEDNVQVRDIAEMVRDAVPDRRSRLPTAPDPTCATTASTSPS